MRITKRSKRHEVSPYRFKWLIITALIILSYRVLIAQQKTEVYFGEPNRMDYADGIIEYYDKGYYLLGGFGYESGWVIKTDVNIEPLWGFFI